MIDRNKVMKGLEHCISDDEPCVDCPYKEKCIREGWIVALQKDVLKLLKEQPEVVWCKDCKYGKTINVMGQEITACVREGKARVFDWFCADGEVKQE